MSGSSDQFVQAVLCVFNAEGDARTKAAATSQLEALKSSPDGWKMCLQQLHASAAQKGRDEVKFWCIDAILYAVDRNYASFADSDKEILRRSLMALVRDVCSTVPQTNFVKNKISVLLVRLVKHDYPERWPTFFSELLAALDKGPEVIDLFFRILNTIDQDIVIYDEARQTDEIKHNTLIKDTMRHTALKPLFDAFHLILSTLHASQPQLARSGLKTMAEFISWAEIEHVANQRFVSLFYQFLQNPHLQNAATECLFEMICKKMEPAKKVGMIKQIRLLEVLAGIPISGPNDEFCRKLAVLIGNVGSQLLAAFRSYEEKKTPGLEECGLLLDQALELSFRFVEHRNFKVGIELQPLYEEYINYLKTMPAFTQKQTANFRRIFVVTLHTISYPDWYNFDSMDERELEFDRARELGQKTLRNLALCKQELSLDLTRASLQSSISNMKQLPWNKVEASLHALYVLGEVLNTKLSQMITEEPLRTMVGAVMSSDVSKHSHPQISLAYFSTVVRYHALLDSHPELLGPVLSSFMDARGLHHPHPTVRSQASYSLLRVVKSLSEGSKAKLRPFLDDMLKALQAVIGPIFSRGLTRGTKGLVSVDQALFLCEAIGQLLTSAVTADKCKVYFAQVVEFFTSQLQNALSNKEAWVKADPELSGKRLAALVSALSSLCRGFGADAKQAPDVLGKALELVVQAYLMFPLNESLRTKTVTFLHRMVDALKAGIIPFLPTVLEPLLVHSSPVSLVQLLTLLNQLVNEFKGQLGGSMDAMFTPLVSRIFEALASYAHADAQTGAVAAYSTERSERLALQKAFFTFLRTLVVNQLAFVISSPRNAALTQKVLASVLSGSHEIGDVTANKLCFSVLKALASFWHEQAKAKGQMEPSMQMFLWKDVATQIVRFVLSAQYNPSDAQSASCLRETLDLQATLHTLFDKPYLAFLAELLTSLIKCPPEAAQEYINIVMVKDFKRYQAYWNSFRTQALANKFKI